MTSYRIAVLPGDGAGAEVAHEAIKILKRAELALDCIFELDIIPCGGKYYLEHGIEWPPGSQNRCAQADMILLGAVGWPDPNKEGPVTTQNGKMAGWTPVLGNRIGLDLYANIRPVKLFPGVQPKISGSASNVWCPENVNMVILRENTEGLYAGAGGSLEPKGRTQVAIDNRIITRHASERIIKLAFDIARERGGAPKDGRKRVTCVAKNNVLDGCRFFVSIFHEIGSEYPDIDQEVVIIDAFTQWLITKPEHYDVVVTTNLFGDIITDLASVLQGGMGMAVGCNVGDEHAMFEPIHGSAPDLSPNIANPMAMILATAEGLRWLGKRKSHDQMIAYGDRVEQAIQTILTEGSILPRDLAPEGEVYASTKKITDAIIERL